MAWVTPPTFTVGQDLTSTAMNQISGDLSALAAAAFPAGITGAVVGTPPTDLTKLRMQAGYVTATTNGSGQVVVGFPVAFPTGVIGVFPAQVFGSAFPALCEVTSVSTSAVTLTFLNSTTGAAIATTGVAFSWFAIGF